MALIAESDLNSLIETVYLFRSPADAQRLLDSMAEVKSGELSMMLQINQKNMNEFVLTKDKAIILVQALNEICNGPDAIDDFEFHSRMGATKDEVFKLLAEIQEYIKLSQSS